MEKGDQHDGGNVLVTHPIPFYLSEIVTTVSTY